MCSHWQANSVASRRACASRSIRRVWASSMFGLVQPAGRGRLRAARRRAATTRGSSSAGWPAPSRRPAPAPRRAGLLEPIEERRRHQHAGERQPERLVVRHLLLAQLAIKAARARRLPPQSAAGGRPGPAKSISASRCFGSRVDQRLAEGRGAVVDRLAQRLEDLRVGVLRGVFHQLVEGIDQGQRVLADEVQLVPEPVELRLSASSSSISRREVIVLAIEQRQRDDFVDRHDLRVAQRGGKQWRKSSNAASIAGVPALFAFTRIGAA